MAIYILHTYVVWVHVGYSQGCLKHEMTNIEWREQGITQSQRHLGFVLQSRQILLPQSKPMVVSRRQTTCIYTIALDYKYMYTS